ncbi:hypothetical protein AB1Y20_011121 [Prymnesium parvum]|uniref:50S ribosomal protein L9, chloroplastic n=1 Tax=Prymnesium parvum TaxID=97485 RepID=A0AB34INN8_PRYPA
MLAKKSAKKPSTVQVILNAPVKGLGDAGELVSVKPAYAQNFIVAQGLGAIATKETLDRVAQQEAAAAAAAAAAKAEAEQVEAVLQAVFGKQGAFLKKNVGPDGAIFGSVTSAEISEMISERAGVSVDKKLITAPSISSVGTALAEIKLHADVTMKLKVVVIPASM